MRVCNTLLLRCLGLAYIVRFCCARQHGAESFNDSPPSQRLAVVIPTYHGDLSRTVSSLERWPTTACSPLTRQNMDLVLYYAEGDEDSLAVTSAAHAISSSAGRCFAKTRTVYANLDKEDNIYPKGPSAMFYKMYLDAAVRPHFAEYDALAVIEWDVLVTSERAFEQLYHSAFDETPDFWVKGSRMEGTDFHSNANSKEMWNVLGHINGNAIYNNNDQAFMEYVRYTHARWELDYPFDVALWLTVSDFPYSWPLWQRYSGKFVVTNLISNVGREHIDHDMVSDAIAAETLFIHGSYVDEGNIASIEATKKRRRALGDAGRAPSVARGLQKWREDEKWRKIEKWKTLEKWRRDYGTEDVRMCLSGCTYTSKDGTRGRVCDLSCESGDPYGTLGCGARQGRFGANCRACYNDVTKARRQDTPENRAIMCDTLEPVPTAYDARSLAVVDTGSAPNVARGLQKWREEEKWRKIEKWKTLEKWRRDYGTEDVRMCLSGCTYTSKDGTRGRVCDLSCESGDPYGILGCGARQGRFGANCRACYNDVTKARRQDTPENRAIMCDTLEPVPSAYDARSLAVVDTESAPNVARGLQKWREEEKWRKIEKWKTLEKWRRDYGTEDVRMCLSGCTYTSKDGTRGRVCDLSCESGDPYGTLGCGARQGRFGANCRACYNDVTKARRQDTPENRAIMCDTLEPVPSAYDARSLAVVDTESAPNVARGLQKWREDEKWRKIEKWKTLEKWRRDYGTEDVRMCLSGCTYTSKDGTRGRVCDLSCESGDPYGTLGCGARQGRFGANCRACYNDVTKARRQDTPENRAIMCDILEPVPTAYDARSLAVVDTGNAPNVARGLQKWREDEKWRKIEKWKTLEKWRRDYGTEDVRMCLSGCTYTSKDGTRGRVCDLSCESGEPYGTLGCEARQGRFGANCRACYNDVAKARRQDTPENRAIMCDTLEPVPFVYDTRSLASVVGTGSAINRARGLRRNQNQEKNDGPDDDDVDALIEEAALYPYTHDLVRRDLCTFVAGFAHEVALVEVAVTSILQFVPGVQVVIAAEEASLDAYKSAVGIYPGVTVHSTPNASTASLFADDFCGPSTRLIYYVKPRSVLSRTFTSKDTHSPTGDLLVVYSNSRLCYRDSALARQTSAMLGFEAPTFTCGTDLMLPVGANADLREVLASGTKTKVGEKDDMTATALAKLGEINDVSAVPQMLAAVAYSRKATKVWFIDPQAWVSEHLFKAASIWEIPLVKPHFSCSLELDTADSVDDVASVLQHNLDFFTQGGTCENGILVPV